MEDQFNQQFNPYTRNYLRQLRNEITKEVDNDKVKTMIEKGQIKLLSGNKLLYERMHSNLEGHKFESLFAQEQMMLYEIRKAFFYEFCGRLPSLFDNTTPFHIIKNFEVMAMVCSTSDPFNLPCWTCPEDWKCLMEYIEEDVIETDNVRLFDRKKMERIAVDREHLEEFGLGFNDAAQMIMAVHRVGPCSLFESALKATVLNDLSLVEMPKAIQNVASQGLYKLEDDIPENLTLEGKQLFGRLKAQYEEETELE